MAESFDIAIVGAGITGCAMSSRPGNSHAMKTRSVSLRQETTSPSALQKPTADLFTLGMTPHQER